MDKLFLQILNMSITASYVILFVMLARMFLKKAPKILSYSLWSVVFFRLVSPIQFESIFSLIPVRTQTISHNIIYSQTPKIHSGINTIDNVVNNSLTTPDLVEVGVYPIQAWLSFAQSIWLVGVILLVLYSVITTIRFAHKLKVAKPIFDNIYETNGIKTPFVFGGIKPRIYLPEGLSENEKPYIIKHEQTHIKRFDHIIKALAFLVLTVHWFNPLVWIAFFLMSEDMELSCDERVIKEMGSGIKQDYSTSLLCLSTGRIIGGCPLAFGESNTKTRIINILNYKKPTFWVVTVAVIGVIAISLGLMSNPLKEKLTVEAYATQFVEEEIERYNNFEASDYKIIDSKITRLEMMVSFDHITSSPVEVWYFEYRLKPDDISKVLFAGGMNEVDGWITEESSMGKPLLVFSYEGSGPKYLGYLMSGEGDLSSIAGQETALRVFLEGKSLLPNETYPGNHIIVKFPLSTGEISQVFLSQPVVQGDSGIWCVEREKDTNGNVYYHTPQTSTMIIDYYKELQKQSDNGNNQLLLDPIAVALDYINNVIGQRVSLDEIDIQYDAKVEDFAKTPESHFIGFISNFNLDSISFHLDKIEWLTHEDTERLAELNIDTYDMPNGFYIYNPENYPMHCMVTDQTQYNIINWEAGANHKSVTKEEFIEHFKIYSDFIPPSRIIIKDGYVQSITEQYVP